MENYEFLPSKYKKCEISMTQGLEYKEYLIVKLVVPITNQRKLENHLDLNIKLQNIPTILKKKKKNYITLEVI